MAGINDIIDEYLGVAISPEEMRDLAMLQVKDASVQDDAVQKAVANAQGVETRNRSALEEYLRMADEQAAAESQRALEMAQQRLNAIDNNMALISTTVGVGKEGKQKLKSLEAERQAILEAFPQLGKAPEGSVSMVDDNTFDIAKMLSEKDYSPETIAKLFETNDRDIWDQALRTGDLDLYQAMLDSKLGALPEGMAEKMRYTVAGMPETSKALKLNDKYSRLRGILGETQGDLKAAARKEAAAAKKAKEAKEEKERLDSYVAEMGRALNANNSIARSKFQTQEFKNMLSVLKKKNLVKPEDEAKLKGIVGEF